MFLGAHYLPLKLDPMYRVDFKIPAAMKGFVDGVVLIRLKGGSSANPVRPPPLLLGTAWTAGAVALE